MKWKPKKGNEQPTDEHLRSKNLPALAVESVKASFSTTKVGGFQRLETALRLFFSSAGLGVYCFLIP
jgi:hypothetical protein